MYCSKCGVKFAEGSNKCENCGAAAESGIKKDVYTYDYTTVQTSQKSAPEIMDCYESLGWELSNINENYGFVTTLNFKRNRKIKNKDQLNRLQVRMDDAINGISVLEREKTKNAMIVSLILGIIGTLVFGGGLSLCLLNSLLWSYITGGALAAIGAAVCGLAYLTYKKISIKKTSAMNILIDKKRDDISQICEDAQNLLA